MASDQPHITMIRVRYVECDPMGLAHHSAYPVWFEIGRTERFREHADIDYRAFESDGLFLAVTSLAVRYRSPVRYDDLIELETSVTRLGRARIDHAYTIRRDGLVLTTAETTLACINVDGRPSPLPSHMHE